MRETPMTVDYKSLFTYSVAAVKELDAMVQAQASALAALAARVAGRGP